MGGGKGTSDATDASQTAAANAISKLADISENLFSETEGTRLTYLDQLQEILQSGYSSEQIPVAQKAVESSKTALANTLRQTDSSMAQSGLAGTPYAEATKASTTLAGNQAANQAGMSATQSLLSGLVPTLTGLTGTSVSGLGSASSSASGLASSMYGADVGAGNAKGNQMTSMFGSALGSGGVAGLSACCWIFLEALNGEVLPFYVRQYRDAHMTPRNRRGYYRLAEFLVPRMHVSHTWRRLTQLCMTKPMTCYGGWVYGLHSKGWLFAPITGFWMFVYNLLGNKPLTRANGEEV